MDGARVVQETKPVTFRDLDISRGQQIALDNFVEALSGHVNIFGCTKFGQTASRKLYPTFAEVAQLLICQCWVPARGRRKIINEWSDGALVLQTRRFSGGHCLPAGLVNRMSAPKRGGECSKLPQLRNVELWVPQCFPSDTVMRHIVNWPFATLAVLLAVVCLT